MNVVRKNLGALGIFALFFIAGLIPALLYSKYDIQIYINQFFHPVANNIFLFFTHLAEGWFTIPLLIGLVIYSWRKSLFIGITYLVSTLLVQFFKRLVFDQLDARRITLKKICDIAESVGLDGDVIRMRRWQFLGMR